ncbi:MAG: hypothetical protein COY58_08535 [Gammaproteobacteria bacterium CG_4_10_14_0_8_um_filter_38_16]|nr:MAG: hypothetical protein COY58_08535 [Gammaproteobacteria bacterium CG_4_10_14_0_8_um_filter_38_16]PJA03584.1 MAG: hypothetical protein COX72_04450 [Gammaproteobacteria bacterium CG_4_10_14_0_2_um_filter_38_22]PJB10260.1 MAG: hypothetical protein CO120_05820 [Gammaproteobacteria bacterium CG_4_9_14_3_um_filter_38_9]
MNVMNTIKPNLGFGLGLRVDHYETVLNEKPFVDWFEIITENYLVPGGKPLFYLDKIREIYPMVMHGVSLSIGSSDPLDLNYLSEVKKLAKRVQPKLISDHLCFTGVNHKNTHDLLPLPYTEEMIEHVVSRIKQVQDFLGRQILIENASSYITYQQSEMTEWEFISEICKRADCHILFDVNNVYVSSVNHEFNPLDYIRAMPTDRIYQIHLAGHTDMGDYIIDTHDHDITDPVWKLYRETIMQHGMISTMIERDDNIPPLNALIKELNVARKIAAEIEVTV